MALLARPAHGSYSPERVDRLPQMPVVHRAHDRVEGLDVETSGERGGLLSELRKAAWPARPEIL